MVKIVIEEPKSACFVKCKPAELLLFHAINSNRKNNMGIPQANAAIFK
tara:strand:+ start:767 stop:910 length:144 start_codon:yes stop_codon:yes gene_type:complete